VPPPKPKKAREAIADAHVNAHALLEDLPKLHYWGGEEQVGGLNVPIGQRVITELEGYDSPRVIETGAGATTLLFCCFEPKAVTSIAPSEELGERITSEAERRGISLEPLRFLSERSEVALPRLWADGERFDVGLIDGSHGWPAVFVDFCYINAMLPANGTLFVDDVQLFSVSQLHLLLREQKGFEEIAVDGKLATFRKLGDDPFLPDWNWEPYIQRNSPVPS
jgi:hypothetical protein